MRLGPLRPRDRASLEHLLSATRAFSKEEIAVAMQLFTMSVTDEPRSAAPVLADTLVDYEFVGAFQESDVLAGYACFGPAPATEGTWDLYWLAVHPDAQGAGVGRSLVKWVEGELASRGARLLVVETSSRPDYARTREFYVRGGYHEAARVRDFYAPADDRIILTTRLTRESGVATR